MEIRGKTQRAILDYVNEHWHETILIGDIFNYLGADFKKPSISRALKSLVDKGVLYRNGDFIALADDIKQAERLESIERDNAKSLPWWMKKEFQKN